MKALLVTLALTTALYAIPGKVMAGVVISQTEVDSEIVRRIYLWLSRALIGVNLPEGSEVRSQFENEVIGRTADQLRAHWSRLQFTGRAVPLRDVESDQDVIDYVQSSPHAIGYVSNEELVGDDVHILARF
jgi:hypothetical protein